MKITLVNGIHTDGEGNIDNLKIPLRQLGHQVSDPILPKRNAFTARWGWKRDVEILKRVFTDVSTDIAIAHSYGGFRTLRALESPLHTVKCAFLFAPAIEVDYDLSKITGTPRIYVIHSENDRAIWWGTKLWGHFFGNAGREGLTSPKNPNNLYVENIAAHGNTHNSYFKLENARQWVQRIHGLITK